LASPGLPQSTENHKHVGERLASPGLLHATENHKHVGERLASPGLLHATENHNNAGERLVSHGLFHATEHHKNVGDRLASSGLLHATESHGQSLLTERKIEASMEAEGAISVVAAAALNTGATTKLENNALEKKAHAAIDVSNDGKPGNKETITASTSLQQAVPAQQGKAAPIENHPVAADAPTVADKGQQAGRLAEPTLNPEVGNIGQAGEAGKAAVMTELSRQTTATQNDLQDMPGLLTADSQTSKGEKQSAKVSGMPAAAISATRTPEPGLAHQDKAHSRAVIDIINREAVHQDDKIRIAMIGRQTQTAVHSPAGTATAFQISQQQTGQAVTGLSADAGPVSAQQQSSADASSGHSGNQSSDNGTQGFSLMTSNVRTEGAVAVSGSGFHNYLSQKTDHGMNIIDSMQYIARSAKNGKTRLEIQLEPANLGKIQISLQTDAAKQLQIHLIADQGATRHAIEQQLPALKTALAQQGLDLSGFSMGSGREGAPFDSRGRPESNGFASVNHVSLSDSGSPVTSQQRIDGGSGRLSIHI
jgi:flagellar hook-length control protein FliK